MAKFKVGVDIERTQSTTIVVEVEADTLAEAERKAVAGAQQKCYRATGMEHLGIGPYHEWGDDSFAALGANHEEDWSSDEWGEPDLKV